MRELKRMSSEAIWFNVRFLLLIIRDNSLTLSDGADVLFVVELFQTFKLNGFTASLMFSLSLYVAALLIHGKPERIKPHARKQNEIYAKPQ